MYIINYIHEQHNFKTARQNQNIPFNRKNKRRTKMKLISLIDLKHQILLYSTHLNLN